MALDSIEKLLYRHEGERQYPYDDTTGNLIELPTGGKITIGIGFNLTDVGLYPEEIQFILTNRINRTEMEVERAFPWYHELDEVRRAVVLDMAYNMGVPTLLTFRNTLGFIKDGDYQRAAQNMGRSLWARQVKGRAKRLMRMMETGQWPAS
jgi:lysozyme